MTRITPSASSTTLDPYFGLRFDVVSLGRRQTAPGGLTTRLSIRRHLTVPNLALRPRDQFARMRLSRLHRHLTRPSVLSLLGCPKNAWKPGLSKWWMELTALCSFIAR
jgi:hypothetical protein